jgi:hypothetical protein
MKKSITKKLKEKAEELPVIPQHIPAIYTGAELAENIKKENPNATHFNDASGKKLKSDDQYVGWQVGCVNHYTRLKDAYKRGGEKAVTQYCVWVVKERSRLNKLSKENARLHENEKVI